MQLKNKIFAIAISLLYVILYNSAFSQQVVFNKLTQENGQTITGILGIAQDKNGKLWFSTDKGVYSYDGVQKTTLRNNPQNPNSLAYNFAHAICADNDGMIWIGTLGSGLDRYDPFTGEFTHYRNDPNDPSSLAHDTVTSVLIDRNGTLWIGTYRGLDKYDPETNTFIHHKSVASDPSSLSSNQVRVIYEDSSGTLWIGTGSPWTSDAFGPNDGGLNKMNKETGTFIRYLYEPDNPTSLFNNKVSAIFEDNTGTLWVGTWKYGIQKMNKDQETFEQVLTESKLSAYKDEVTLANNGLTDDLITFITQDVTGKIWIGTYASGLYNYDPENKNIISKYGPGNLASGFSEGGARTAFNSRDGILWIGSLGNIYSIDPSIKQIKRTSVSGSSVSSFYEEPNGDFWIGTRNEIIRIIKDSGVTHHYKTDDYIIDPPGGLGYMVYGDREGNIWVGTPKGLNRFNKKTEKFISYKHDPRNNNSISDSFAIFVYEDRNSNFWVGTANGLNLMDRETGHFKRFYANPDSSEAGNKNVITSIEEDHSGNLWISNYNGMGVNRFNPESKEFKIYLKNTWVIQLCMDSDGVLWAGATNGLYKYESNADYFIPFSPNGTISNIAEVNSIVEDNQKNLWLTERNQIVRINPERDEVSYFGQNYGISQNSFNFLSGCIRSNGEIYFGDTIGYFSFFPDELIKNSKTPELVFTGFHLFDRKLTTGDGGPLEENLNDQKVIKLQYNQNVFSIDLAIVDYTNPALNRLIYYLEDYDVSWRDANSERRAYYFNVPPGKYTFRLKGVNSYGAWAEKTIDITIMPPWWKTWLAYIIYALLLVAAIVALDRVMRRRIVEKERRKTQERELAHAKEIEKAYKELKSTQTQLIQSEKMASLGELTAGIAHEIQNPLNFVNNFSEVNNELLDDLKEAIVKNDQTEIESILKDLKENESKVTIHGKRAESIVKGMLLHSRGSSGQKEPTDINALCDEYLRLSYHGFRAKDKSFNADFKLEADESLPKINVVPQDIGRVILNLVNNAFFAVNEKVKQTGNSFKPLVVITTNAKENNIKITVSDNGNGIPDSVKNKIFQPFFTTKPTGQGTGLGLSLSYDIIKAHGGELKVETEEGKGSKFIIQFSTV